MRSLRVLVPVVLSSVALSLAVGCSSAAPTHTDLPGTGSSMPQPAPQNSWPAPADASAAATAAGLPMLGTEMLAVHYHAHLDILVDGKPVTVPQYLGIDLMRQKISPLHTHDSSGVVHIESAADIPFTLGQVFAEWGQPMTPTKVGPVALTPTETLRVFVNGKQIGGDPASHRLKAHDEIAVVVGPPGVTPQIPASYNFPAGL